MARGVPARVRRGGPASAAARACGDGGTGRRGFQEEVGVLFCVFGGRVRDKDTGRCCGYCNEGGRGGVDGGCAVVI